MDAQIFDTGKEKPTMAALPAVIIAVALILFIGLVLTVLTFTVSSPAASYNYEAQKVVSPSGLSREMVHDFTWVLYPVFLISIFFFYNLAVKFVLMRKNEFGLMLALMGAVLLLVSLLSLFGMTSAFQHLEDQRFPLNLRIGWAVEFFTFAVVGAILSFIGNKLNDGKTPLIGTVGFLLLPAILVSTLFLAGIGLNDAIIYTAPTSRVPLSAIEFLGWMPTAALFLILAVLGGLVLKKKAGLKGLLPNVLPLKFVGGFYLVVALIAFIWGMNVVISSNFAVDAIFRWLAQSISFGALGTIAFLFAMKINRGAQGSIAKAKSK
jgi:hypothetical protein